MSALTTQPARRRLAAVATAAAAAALLAGTTPAAAQARAPARTAGGARAVVGRAWGAAEEVPGTAALNAGGNAGVNSVSCPSAGNCSAGGWYAVSPGLHQTFVVSQVHGAWGTAAEVPGSAALNAGGFALINAVSCASAGDCSAAGQYLDASLHYQALVATQAGGTWHKAIEVPGTAALNAGGFAGAFPLSCGSAGNCATGGFYEDSAGHFHGFLASQVHGRWHTAIEVPGPAGGGLGVSAVSCAPAGPCTASGGYTDSAGHNQAYVVTQAHGGWGKATQVPGTAALNQGGRAAAYSLSCPSAGNCAAGGSYTDSAGHTQVFVASQAGGTWHKAIEVPGLATLSTGSAGFHSGSLSCASAGNCAVGGSYTDSAGHTQAFIATQVNGTWHPAIEVPGTAALNTGGNAGFGSVSCPTAGNCSAGGTYTDSAGHTQVFVVSQVHGTWRTAKEVPGTAALNAGGNAKINTISCAPTGTCTAGGGYADSASHQQAFLVNKA
jgi:hypothetical protein